MKLISSVQRLFMKLLGLDIIAQQNEELCSTAAYLALQALFQQEKYVDTKKLSKCGFKVHSQGDEDGFIHEIFRRIGIRSKVFVEIGVSHGLECNTLYLLRQGWRGIWVDGDLDYGKQVRTRFSEELNSGDLIFHGRFVDLDNIHEIFETSFGDAGVDFLSVDIDGNDYYLIQSILLLCRPTVVALEYNPVFAPPIEWKIKYDIDHRWDVTDHYSASLKSYELMMRERGYCLVGCGMNGNNAFFVRDDAVDNHFCSDTSAEFHYEPQRFWITRAFRAGYPMRQVKE
jgi:hypothetical protein